MSTRATLRMRNKKTLMCTLDKMENMKLEIIKEEIPAKDGNTKENMR